MRLIDADALISVVEKESNIDGAYGYMDTKSIVDVIDDAPTIEPMHWIPVNEKLPEKDAVVLATDGEDISFAWVDGGMWVIFWAAIANRHWDWADSGEVIAWMPLPEPYKGGAE